MLKSTLYFCAIIFLVLSSGVLSMAAKNKPAPAHLQIDTAKISVKHFDKQAIGKYREDKDFNYNGRGVGDEPTLWDRFWNWVWDIIRGVFKSVPFAGSILTYSLLALGIGFLVYAILKSVGIDPARLFKGSGGTIGLSYSESLENIHDINFDAEIERAISQHDFRLAVRLLYLKCLKQLSDSHLIDWQIDKTNSAYLVELIDTNQKQKFGLLTRQFEFVWYGNFPIDQQAFGSIFSLFQDFKKQLP